MQNMSEKDKRTLIIVAAVLLLIVGIVGVIKPAFTTVSTDKATNAKLKVTKTTMETEIAKLSTYEDQLNTAQDKYMDTASGVYGALISNTIDNAVTTSLVAGNGLSPITFSINEIITMSPASYGMSYDSASGTYINNGGFIADEKANTKVANVTVSASGTYAQVITFLDTLNKNTGVQLLNAAYATSDGTTTVNASFLMILSEDMSN